MRFALDATYSLDPQPTGIAVYSKHLLDGLAAAYPHDKFIHCYRAKQYRRARRSAFSNIANRILLPGVPTFQADLFHSLNQRIDKRPARKVVATFHDLFVMTGEYSSPEFRARFTAQAKQAAHHADLIIAVSAFTASQVSSLLHVDPAKIRVIPHGVQLPPTRPAVPRQPFILFIGALQERKNIKRLVEAFESLPMPWRLVLAGAPTGYKADEILARIDQSASRQRIEITGYISQEKLHNLLARASIFAFPSLDEGFGMPVLDAMAWEIPVVTANASALDEIAGDAALLVNPRSVPDIADALGKLAGQESLRQELIAAGKIKVREFSWQQAVDKTYSVYRELTG